LKFTRIASAAAAATLAVTAGLGLAGPARSFNSFGPKVSHALAAPATCVVAALERVYREEPGVLGAPHLRAVAVA
jgi:hypothetical protein